MKRRQIIQALGLTGTAALAASSLRNAAILFAAEGPSFPITTVNHLSISVADYAKTHGASFEHWYFLTGPQATLQKLDRDAFKLGNVDETLEHSTRFVLVDRQAHIRGYYDTSESSAIPRLISAIYELSRIRS